MVRCVCFWLWVTRRRDREDVSCKEMRTGCVYTVGERMGYDNVPVLVPLPSLLSIAILFGPGNSSRK
jgi:hypothetical protein